MGSTGDAAEYSSVVGVNTGGVSILETSNEPVDVCLVEGTGGGALLVGGGRLTEDASYSSVASGNGKAGIADKAG